MTMISEAYVSPAARKKLDIKEYSRHSDRSPSLKKSDDFYQISKKAKDHVFQIYDEKVQEKSEGKTKEDYVSIYHDAMLGLPAAVSHIKKIIESYIIENGLKGTAFPLPYQSLVDAIFEEEFGWGVLSAYKHEPDSEAAQVIGTDVTIKRAWGYELQPYSFRSIEQVLELTQRFANMHSKTTLNEHSKPELETRTHDNIRVSIMVPGRTHEEPVITLRRKVVNEISFESMAEYKTIPHEALPLFKALARFKVNSVIAGPPGCGKSTMLQAFMASMLFETRKGQRIPERLKTVYVEKFPEWDVRKLHPHSNVMHILGSGKEFEDTISAGLLRHDVSRIIVGEIREHEVGLYRRASVQGIKQLMGTLHDLDPINIPEIMRDLYMQYFPVGIDEKALQRTFNANIHFSVSMDEFINEKEEFEKKVTGIHIYEPGTDSSTVRMYTIMEYNNEHDNWTYRNELPERFKRMAAKYDRLAFAKFLEQLDLLAMNSSVRGR